MEAATRTRNGARFIGELAMLLIYFGCFLPIGLVFRVVKYDALKLDLEESKTTYWETKKSPTNMASITANRSRVCQVFTNRAVY